MRYLFGFMCVLALSVVLVACGGEGPGCAEPAADAAGEWEMTATPIEDTCGGDLTPYTFGVTIMQEGNALSGQTPEGTMTGTICGDQVQMSGSSPEAGGTATVNLELTVSADGNSVEGSDTWNWTNGAQSCGGSESLSGTRIDSVDATCSPWCTVVDDCTTMSFSDCMNACAEELSQAQSISPECASAVRSQNICLAELTCAELEAWATGVPPDSYPCKSADDDVGNACFG